MTFGLVHPASSRRSIRGVTSLLHRFRVRGEVHKHCVSLLCLVSDDRNVGEARELGGALGIAVLGSLLQLGVQLPTVGRLLDGIRPRLAPSAVRTAISRRLPAARASSRLATFTHDIVRAGTTKSSAVGWRP